MPALPDNDPRKWKYELHTTIKHQILIKYLEPWSKILGSWSRGLALVDGFAGRGRYPGGEEGSPLLVLNVAQKALASSSIRTERIACHLVEANPDNFHNMEREVQRHPGNHDPMIDIYLYRSRFAEVSADIVGRIRQAGQSSFFFLDPFGYDDPPMETLRSILALDRAEVLVNLMFDFANRAINIEGNPALSRTLDELFGSGNWRSLIELEGEQRERGFVDLYREQLKARGAGQVVRFPMGYDESERTLYYLVHATKHPKGALLMKDVMASLSSPGALGYRGAERHHSRPLFDLDAAEVPDTLLARFAERTVSFEGLITETVEDDSALREKDYRKAIQGLERDHRVAVERVESSRRGLKGKDLITFRQQLQQPQEEPVQLGLLGIDPK